jgi:putative SOS response-associated peptidase YedK
MNATQTFRELSYTMRPQDPHGGGTGLRFETGEHGRDYPDNMPQTITVTDAQGRSAVRAICPTYQLPDGPPRNLQAHYNVAPTDPVDVVKLATGSATELVSMRWGLVPWWWKKPLKQLPASFNARAETVADKPMFRDSFARHWCVIPASGYCELRTLAAVFLDATATEA